MHIWTNNRQFGSKCGAAECSLWFTVSEDRQKLHNKLTPKKHLGQHFLHDANVLAKIAALVQPQPNEYVLEIGPGEGALTQVLVQQLINKSHLVAVEVDPNAASHLRLRFAANLGFELIEHDVLTYQPPPKPGVLVGNLPYNISSPIFFWLLEHRQWFREATVMVQHEVAARICSGPGSKEYGILSVLIGYFFTTKYQFRVSPGAFRPPPAVQSAVFTLTRRTTLNGPEVSWQALRIVVKAAFNQRRKTLRNALKSIGLEPPAHLAELRAEQLSIPQFAELALLLQHTLPPAA